MSIRNEVRKCGCTVVQQTFGRTKWNRLQLCSDHQERPNQIFPLASLGDLTDEGLRELKVWLEDELEERERVELNEDVSA